MGCKVANIQGSISMSLNKALPTLLKSSVYFPLALLQHVSAVVRVDFLSIEERVSKSDGWLLLSHPETMLLMDRATNPGVAWEMVGPELTPQGPRYRLRRAKRTPSNC